MKCVKRQKMSCVEQKSVCILYNMLDIYLLLINFRYKHNIPFHVFTVNIAGGGA